jgi:hypothetical protein
LLNKENTNVSDFIAECSQRTLMMENMFIDLEDKFIVAVACVALQKTENPKTVNCGF